MLKTGKKTCNKQINKERNNLNLVYIFPEIGPFSVAITKVREVHLKHNNRENKRE